MSELLITQLEKRVLNNPEKLAICEINGEKITYKDLWVRASLVADFLESKDIGFNDNVALIFTKSIDYITCMIGVMISRATFIPIDANQPAERINYILEKVKPELIITNSDLNNYLGEYSKIDYENLSISFYFSKGFDKSNRYNQQYPKEFNLSNSNVIERIPEIAYIIFTSGSTGNPKGVKISHSGLSAVINEQIDLFDLDENSFTYFIYNISFDASLSDIWTTLISGATLYFKKNFVFKGEKDLFEEFEKLNITHVDLPPSIFKFLNPINAPQCLNTIILGGEISNIEDIHNWINNDKNIISVYGPTEATICSSMEKCDLNWDHAYIGKPLSTVNYHVEIDEDNTGELLISGDCLAIGYLDEDKLNQEKFIYKNNIRYYKTGDLVKLYPDKRIEFLGRIDRQIKFKGYLICPEEIENKLKNYPEIKNCVIRLEDNNLSCFIESDLVIETEKLNGYLEQFFAKNMIPSKYIFIDKLPLLPNGKLDIKKVSAKRDGSKSLNNDLILILSENFKKVLKLEKIDLDLSFFDLGGDSFSLLSLIVECEKSGLSISPEDIYKFKSINRLVDYLNEKNDLDNNVDKLLQRLEYLKKQFPKNYQLRNKILDQLNKSNSKNIFITGVTGFLGSRVLNELLENTKANVYCLIRDKKKFDLLQIDTSNQARVIPIIGDITDKNFNLDDKTFKKLQDNIDSIYHIAADINHFKSYQQLEKANVISLLTILEIMAKGKYKSLNYASSLSVFVDTDPLPNICLENEMLENTQKVYGGYAQTKWLNEKLLQASKDYGDINIYRLGLLTRDDSKNINPSSDWLESFIKGIIQLKIIPKLDYHSLYFDFTPVDYSAKSLVLNSLENKSNFENYHISSTKKVSFSVLIQALKNNGIALKIVSKDQWLDYIINKQLSDFEMVTYLALKDNNSHLSIFKVSNTSFDIGNSSKIDLLTPEINQQTIDNFVKRLLDK